MTKKKSRDRIRAGCEISQPANQNSQLAKFRTLRILFFKKKIKIKQFIYIYIYIYNKNNNIYHIRQNSAQCTKKQTCYSEGKYYCCAKFRYSLRKFQVCEISQPTKFRRLRNFCAFPVPPTASKILIKTTKINIEKLRKFAEK